MYCLPVLTLDTDKPYWISRETFYSEFDQEDFMCRDQSQVTTAYLRDWFFERCPGELGFFIPTVGIVSGKTQFINGRHRTAVLLPHLKEIPIAFSVEYLGEEGLNFIARLPKRAVSLAEYIKLPDLEIFTGLPMRN